MSVYIRGYIYVYIYIVGMLYVRSNFFLWVWRDEHAVYKYMQQYNMNVSNVGGAAAKHKLLGL